MCWKCVAKAGAALAFLGAAAGLAGCSAGVQPARIAGKRKPIPGVVSLNTLAQANPDWRLVKETDSAIARYQGLLAMPALSQAGSAAAPQVSLPPVPKNVLPASTGRQGAQEVHLERLGQAEIARLSQSLDQAESERLAAEQKIAANRAEQSFISSRGQALERLLAVQRAILAGNEAEVINLVLQIAAANENAKWPATAPDDYWGKIAAQKEAQLASLNDTRTRQLDLAQAASDAELRSLQASLNDQAAADVAKVRAEIDRENEAVTQNQEERLARQRSWILAMTTALEKEEVESVASLESSIPASAGEAAGPEEAATRSTEGIVARSLPGWRTRLVETITGLQRQRDRQAALVTEETRRAVARVAQQSALRITGWQSEGKGRDLTPLVLSRLRQERWGGARSGQATS